MFGWCCTPALTPTSQPLEVGILLRPVNESKEFNAHCSRIWGACSRCSPPSHHFSFALCRKRFFSFAPSAGDVEGFVGEGGLTSWLIRTRRAVAALHRACPLSHRLFARSHSQSHVPVAGGRGLGDGLGEPDPAWRHWRGVGASGWACSGRETVVLAQCWLAGSWLVLFGGLLRVPSPVSLTPGWINGLPTTKSSVWPTTAFLTVVQRLTSNEP